MSQVKNTFLTGSYRHIWGALVQRLGSSKVDKTGFEPNDVVRRQSTWAARLTVSELVICCKTSRIA